MTGVVVDPNGNPVEGATVREDRTGLSVTTGPDGRFSIPGVRADQGENTIAADALIGGEFFSGASTPTSPVADGTTDVGVITLSLGVMAE